MKSSLLEHRDDGTLWEHGFGGILGLKGYYIALLRPYMGPSRGNFGLKGGSKTSRAVLTQDGPSGL